MLYLFVQESDNDGENPNETAAESNHTEVELNTLSETATVLVEGLDNNKADVDFHTIIFDCSLWSFVDSMGVKVLKAVRFTLCSVLFNCSNS